MFKKLLIVAISTASFAALAAPQAMNSRHAAIQYNSDLHCVYDDDLYSIGALIEEDDRFQECKAPASSTINTAHWQSVAN